jgi:hypothetical protein
MLILKKIKNYFDVFPNEKEFLKILYTTKPNI